MKINKELELVLKEQDVSKTAMAELAEAFGAPFTEVGEILATYKDIEVTNAEQIELMEEAREKRLALKRVRTGVEKKRKELKEDSLKTGRAIDRVASYVKETIEPAEEYLKLQEDYVKVKKQREMEAKRAGRIEKLLAIGQDPSLFNLDEMSDEMFTALIEDLEKRKAEEEAKLKAEEDARIKAEQEREAEAKRIREENAKLKAEADKREAELKKEREAIEAQRREAEEKQAKEQARLHATLDNLRSIGSLAKSLETIDSTLEELKTYANNLPDDLKANQTVRAEYGSVKGSIVETKVRLEEQAKQAEAKARAEEEAKASTAPDAEKLIKFADALLFINENKKPEVSSVDAKRIIDYIGKDLEKLASKIKEEAGRL